jgi:Domain of unknown function (DUF4386)
MSRITNPGRFVGVLYGVTLIFGFFAVGYVLGKLIVHGDTAATSSNISAHETLFRLSIASQLIGMAGFISARKAANLEDARENQTAEPRSDDGDQWFLHLGYSETLRSSGFTITSILAAISSAGMRLAV